MPPAQVSDRDVRELEEIPTTGVRNLSMRANWRIIAVTVYIGLSLFEYGFDKGAIAGFQAMPGFLQVFGYQDQKGHYQIRVGLSLYPRLMLRGLLTRLLCQCRLARSKSSRPS